MDNDNGTDVNLMPVGHHQRTTSSSYNPYDDVNGDGTINGTDIADIRPDSGRLATSSPTAPSNKQVGGLETGALKSAQDTGTALGVVESTSNSASGTSSATANNTAGSVAAAVTSSPSSSNGSSLISDDESDDSSGSSSQATDEAVASFDLADPCSMKFVTPAPFAHAAWPSPHSGVSENGHSANLPQVEAPRLSRQISAPCRFFGSKRTANDTLVFS